MADLACGTTHPLLPAASELSDAERKLEQQCDNAIKVAQDKNKNAAIEDEPTEPSSLSPANQVPRHIHTSPRARESRPAWPRARFRRACRG